MTGLKEVVGEELSLGYPLFQRLHNNNHPRPLIPKPYLSSTNHNYINNNHNNNNSPSSYLNRLPQHHHNFGTNKGDEGNNNNNKDNNVSMTHNQVMVSSRWNPTPEQLSALEELYRCGTRTPSAEQIQHITAQLGRYGKIEGKNVFYWFQNHKARERQKRRRLLSSTTTTIHANHSTDNAQEGFQNEEKSCKRTSLIKSKEYDPPIDSNLGPRKADKISSSNNNSSTNNNECLHFHENCAQFQHNYNILSPKHTHFMTSSQNQTNVNYNNINNINISNINNININNTNTNNNNDNNNNININLQPCLSSFHDLKNVTTKTTTSVTLQLFPLSEQEEEEEDEDDDVVDELKAKKDRQDILSSFGKNDNENVMSCMDSNYFVPYYQFL